MSLYFFLLYMYMSPRYVVHGYMYAYICYRYGVLAAMYLYMALMYAYMYDRSPDTSYMYPYFGNMYPYICCMYPYLSCMYRGSVCMYRYIGSMYAYIKRLSYDFALWLPFFCHILSISLKTSFMRWTCITFVLFDLAQYSTCRHLADCDIGGYWSYYQLSRQPAPGSL